MSLDATKYMLQKARFLLHILEDKSRRLHELTVYTSPGWAVRCQSDVASGSDDPEQVQERGCCSTFLLIVAHLEI